MSADINIFFQDLWQDYLTITPSAEKIHALLARAVKSNNNIVNDHVAFRTFNHSKVNLARLTPLFEAMGYEQKGEYTFKAKKLNAVHFEHADPTQPKVFISELLCKQFPESVQRIIQTMVDRIDDLAPESNNFLYSGTHWQVSQQDYATLLEHSEYAAWMSAWGYRANHFTVSVNQLAGDMNLSQVNQILTDANYALNQSGGEIKGSAEVGLAQSSTMADKVEVTFADGSKVIPSCFYEFAERFPLENGELYQGFVEASADKIFESTNAS